jgi:Cysteine rich repeat
MPRPITVARVVTLRCDPLERSMQNVLVAALALLVAVAAMQTARADDREAAKKACMADYKKHCSGVLPGDGRVKTCLTENLARLEPACREIVARHASGEKASQSK